MSGLRVAVTGLAATYPYGGVFWDYLQYALGLLRLGHDVLYIEDTGKWCYHPEAGTFVEDGRENAELLARRVRALEPELADRWFLRDATGATYGRPWREVVEFCRTADLFLHLSASCWMREEYWAADTVAFVDSDPMYTQASVPDYLAGTIDESARARVEMLRCHDVFFTFAENIGRPDCRIPRGLFDWIPTRQPIVLDCFPVVPVDQRQPRLTTVGSWEASADGLKVDGVAYGGKSEAFERFIELPTHSSLPLHLALSGEAPAERLTAHGWQLDDPNLVSLEPEAYRDYLGGSLGEWSVAKPAYAAGRTGWFSCRTACYLASGVPAVVEDTGFVVPTGEGLWAFTTIEEAAAAIEDLAADPLRHAKAAAELAHDYFDARTVLTELIDQAGSTR